MLDYATHTAAQLAERLTAPVKHVRAALRRLEADTLATRSDHWPAQWTALNPHQAATHRPADRASTTRSR